MRGIGFLMAVVCAAGLDGMGWQKALFGVVIGLMLMVLPYVMKGARKWIAS